MYPKPTLFTCLSPALLHLYDISDSIVVIIDVLRATSTIATALYNGASAIIPVASVERCIELGKQLNGITAGERDGKVAEGLAYGNSPFEYPREFIDNKLLVLTTTNGTKLLHMALEKNAKEIITGSFANLSAICDYLLKKNTNVILGCSAWKDRINIEDTLFAGAVINRIQHAFEINCDSSHLAQRLDISAESKYFEYLKVNNASHYRRLTAYGLEEDIRYCLTPNLANIVPYFKEDRLIIAKSS
jgi:2-phosphosulfolactate phosphatase